MSELRLVLCRIGLLLAGLLLVGQSCWSQEPGVQVEPSILPTSVTTEGPVMWSPAASPVPRLWGSVDYLLWWTSKGPLAFPLVTTGDPSDPLPGVVGQPGTRPLFGGQGLNFNGFSGMRVTLGGWLDDEQLFGLEASAFFLEHRGLSFTAAGDANGNPPIYVPVFRPDLGREGAFIVSDPKRNLAGSVTVSTTTQLWGSEINGVANLISLPGLTVNGLVGFHYLDLREQLGLQFSLDDHVFDVQQQISSSFNTRDQFYGGQVGARMEYERGPWQVNAAFKLALGGTHQTASIQGQTIQTGAGANLIGTLPGGIFTQPSNIGRQNDNPFTVVPQMQLQLQRQLFGGFSVYAGYDALYWSSVVRPGNVIDRSVNLSQQFGGTLVGTAAPLPRMEPSGFWAQGVSFGLLWKF
jgi:hypothetical protein